MGCLDDFEYIQALPETVSTMKTSSFDEFKRWYLPPLVDSKQNAKVGRSIKARNNRIFKFNPDKSKIQDPILLWN